MSCLGYRRGDPLRSPGAEEPGIRDAAHFPMRSVRTIIFCLLVHDQASEHEKSPWGRGLGPWQGGKGVR